MNVIYFVLIAYELLKNSPFVQYAIKICLDKLAQ